MHLAPPYRSINRTEIAALLAQVPLFADEGFACIKDADLLEVPAGTTVIAQNQGVPAMYVLLTGQLRVTRTEEDGGTNLLFYVAGGEIYGEGGLFFGMPEEPATVETVSASTLLRVLPDAFWRLLGECPSVRRGVVTVVARRFELYQTIVMHRQSLLSIGTLSAGLMHELNNPVAAALRAVGQLRENLTRLQQVCLRLTRERLTDEQINCSCHLQEQAMMAASRPYPSAMDRTDAEEALATWIEGIGVADAWRVAPTLCNVGWDATSLECARLAFSSRSLSDTINLIEASISSVQLLGTMEESMSRVTGLVAAVKKYAHDDEDEEEIVNVHESLQSAVTIISHKLRPKELFIEESLKPELSKIKTRGKGFIQVFTNLLENAIDASPDHGTIRVRTWAEGALVCVGIADQGAGIPVEKRPRIFEPFFTTKPFTSGPGLGLHIVHRIVVGQCSGQVTFTSEPGATEFIVRLPIETS